MLQTSRPPRVRSRHVLCRNPRLPERTQQRYTTTAARCREYATLPDTAAAASVFARRFVAARERRRTAAVGYQAARFANGCNARRKRHMT